MMLEPADWYRTLPKFLAAAAALITDAAGRILLVKPNYRGHWNLPGGILEATEPPHLACAREVREELGVEVRIAGLLVVDWVAPTDIRPAWFGFVYDGGTVDPVDIVLQAGELDAFAFTPVEEALTLVTANTADRIRAALDAKTAGVTVSLFDGRPVAAAEPRPATP